MKNPAYLFILCICIAINACKEDEQSSATCLPDFEENTNGQWYVGDFHVHATGASNDTGGDSDPSSIKTKAIERGLDFVVLTDHSNSTGSDPSTTDEDPNLFNKGPEFPFWAEAAALSDSDFLMVDGNEISPRSESNTVKTGHVGCVPRSLVGFDTESPFIDRPMGTVDGANTIAQARDRNCFVILNHPFNLFPWIAYDWTSFDYDAIEIWNGTQAYDAWDDQSREAWLCDLLSGRKVAAIGGSDNHRVNINAPGGSAADPALAYPSTAVFATDLTWPSIVKGLDDGQTMIYEGDSRIEINIHDEQGCLADASNAYWVRVTGRSDALLLNPVLKITNALSCTDSRAEDAMAPTIAYEMLLEELVEAGADFEYKIRVDGKVGVLSAILNGDSAGHYLALSRAIVLE